MILACAPAQYFGRQHDDALYYLAAQALSEGSYRLPTTPGRPFLTWVMPGFPALLQPAALLFGERTGGYQAFCALLLAACPWLVRAWLARRFDGAAATAAACAFAASPLTLNQAGTLMPEAAYLLLFCALMLAEGGSARGPLLLALSQTRPAALSAFPAAVAAYVARRRWRDAALALAWPAAGAAGWLAWCRARGGAAQEVFEWKATFQGGGLAALAARNAEFYLSALGSTVVPPFLAETPAALAAGVALSAVAGVGLNLALKRDRFAPEAWALLGALAMHLFFGWRYERYLVPLLPLLLWASAHALGRRAWRTFAGLTVLQLLFHGGGALSASARSKPELAPAYEWLARRTRAEDAVASLLYARDGHYAGRPSLPLPPAESPEALARALRARGARYVLWQERPDLGLGEGSPVAATIARTADHLNDGRLFKIVFEDEFSRVYVVVGP